LTARTGSGRPKPERFAQLEIGGIPRFLMPCVIEAAVDRTGAAMVRAADPLFDIFRRG
jgi:hypothetical protein